MENIEKEKVKDKAKELSVKKRKKYKLIDLYGCFKGQIFYDDAVFNLGVKA